MSRIIASFICLLLLAGAPTARPDDAPALSADTAWAHIDDKNGVALYSRARIGSGIKEFKGTGEIDAPPQMVQKVLDDVGNYPDFMPYVTESRIVAQDGDHTTTYQRLNIPFVANRDYTVRVEHGIVTNPAGASIYRDTWETDNQDGPAPRRGVVRVNVNEGSWVLEPSGAGGASTQATYQIYTDSGGVIPAFLANHASQVIIPRLFEALRKQVRDPKYGK